MIGMPTEFRGAVMRSQLEALWALRWHGIGVRWRYEPVKVYLGGVSTYTPDFILGGGVLIQIKPAWPDADAVDRACAAAEILGRPVYFVIGPPGSARFAVTTDGGCLEALVTVPFPT